NVRLFNETQDALARQTATSEILRIISSSPTDVQPVFDAIVQTALRILACDLAVILRTDGVTYSPCALAGSDREVKRLGPATVVVDPAANFPSRVIVSRKPLHIPDVTAIELPPHQQMIFAALGHRSNLLIPLLRESECIGVLALGRMQPGP